MSSNFQQLPDSIKARFPEHLGSLKSRFDSSHRFREICFDYEEVMIDLGVSVSQERPMEDLKALALELEAEILAELETPETD